MASRFRIHLPNIVFQLVHTPDLAANQVAFKVPQHINKLDIRQYLTKIYGVEVSDVRTMNYLGFNSVMAGGREMHSAKFKKAIVTLANGQTFAWPAAPSTEDLDKIRKPSPRSIDQYGKNAMKNLFPNATKNKKKTTAAANAAAAAPATSASTPSVAAPASA
ncbi:mitochondrial 54S ribosomal protein YmL41 [Blastocladiella emersonii ATCC 22665]|nr:mitochondrial 54S ribosomal protein YmL41 [Blastocladiella emersonii ATCC 22665]